MTPSPEKGLYLDRRAGVRIDFHSAAQFVPDPARPLRTSRALTQDLSLRGAQLLTSVVPETEKPFVIWIPVEGERVVRATAQVVWTAVEDLLGDSPYWVRTGVTLRFDDRESREAVASAIARRSSVERSAREQEISKIGFVF